MGPILNIIYNHSFFSFFYVFLLTFTLFSFLLLTFFSLLLTNSLSINSPALPASFPARARHFLSSPLVQRWCRFEFFYSPIDAVLLRESEFAVCLSEAGLENVRTFLSIYDDITIW